MGWAILICVVLFTGPLLARIDLWAWRKHMRPTRQMRAFPSAEVDDRPYGPLDDEFRELEAFVARRDGVMVRKAGPYGAYYELEQPATGIQVKASYADLREVLMQQKGERVFTPLSSVLQGMQVQHSRNQMEWEWQRDRLALLDSVTSVTKEIPRK